MKNKFYLILVTLMIILTACDEKKPSIPQVKSPQVTEKMETQQINQLIEEKKLQSIPHQITELPLEVTPLIHLFKFENLKKQANILEVKNDKYNFKNIKQPIVIISIIATWCPPCRGQIPHLSKLQQKFKENIFVMSTLIHDDISIEKLDKFIIAQKMLFYLSVNKKENLKFVNMITPKLGLTKNFPMPLTLVFVRGKYFTHYEGMIPEEMIESDINQLLEKIKPQQ